MFFSFESFPPACGLVALALAALALLAALQSSARSQVAMMPEDRSWFVEETLAGKPRVRARRRRRRSSANSSRAKLRLLEGAPAEFRTVTVESSDVILEGTWARKGSKRMSNVRHVDSAR